MVPAGTGDLEPRIEARGWGQVHEHDDEYVDRVYITFTSMYSSTHDVVFRDFTMVNIL